MAINGVLRFLGRAAKELRENCPGEARYLLCTRNAIQTVKDKPTDKSVCPFCFESFVPGNHKVRLKPKMKITTRIEKLLKLERLNCSFNLKQIKLLKKYRLSRSVLVVTCNMCKKSKKYPGETRSFLASNNPNTPKAKHGMMTPDMKKNPASGSKSNLFTKPAFTSRPSSSGHPSPSVAARSSKKSKFNFSRLKMLLSQEKKEKSKKGDLQKFLSAL